MRENQAQFSIAHREFGVPVNAEGLFIGQSPLLYEEGGAWLAAKYFERSARPSALCIVNDVSAASFVH